MYVWKDRALVRDMVERAAAAGYEALCITVDAPVLGRRERDVRRGYTLPPKLGPSTIVDGILHPAWTWQFLTSKPIRFANVTGTAENDGRSAISLAEHVAAQFDQGLSWNDIEWFREIWSGPIVVKGIQSVADAVVAADHGIEAIALSNHGGRQLDFAPAPLDLIPAIADAVGDRLEIICDGGARRGSDIVKALALGADAVMAGRPYLYALGDGRRARRRPRPHQLRNRDGTHDGASRRDVRGRPRRSPYLRHEQLTHSAIRGHAGMECQESPRQSIHRVARYVAVAA